MKRALLLLLVSSLTAPAAFSLTAKTTEQIKKEHTDREEKGQRDLENLQRKLNSEKDRLWETRSVPIIADEKEIDVQEPATAEDLLNNLASTIPGSELFWSGTVPGEPVKKFSGWYLRKEDFSVLIPVETELYLAGNAARRFFVLPYSITNSTDQTLTLYPRIWIRTDKGRTSQEVGGFLVRDQVAASILENVHSTQEFVGQFGTKEPNVEKVGLLNPGETRWGVAIFPPLDPEMDQMTVVVEGISNAYNFMLMHRPVLCLDYTRLGDEFHPQLDRFEFNKKYWHSQWMWWQETRMGRPSRFEITGPAGESQHAIWVYDLHLKNSRGTDRPLTITEIATVLGIADPEGKTRPIKVLDDIDITVRLTDDGDSTIYKVDAFQAASRPIQPARFPGKDNVLKEGREITIAVAFEEDDVDWEDVFAQVAEAVTPPASAVYESVFLNVQEPGDSLVLKEALKRGLSEDVKKRVREEVLKQIPDAMQEAFDSRRFTIELIGSSGLAIGKYRVVRDFIRRSTIDSSLIKKWNN
ncbi:MAG: hypothetical protein JW909_01350 [Planctomycetes bacterium]|nr:hypothetical protein [Planctomycetota bacterium]